MTKMNEQNWAIETCGWAGNICNEVHPLWYKCQISPAQLLSTFIPFDQTFFFSENGFGIVCFSFPWSNLLPTRWGKNQLTPSQWPIGCRLPRWCGGGSIFTKKAVQELEHFGQFGLQSIPQEDVWFTGIARLRAGYSDETLVRKFGLRMAFL